ncbi:MAG TPA: NAD(+)/NADH kinase [Polyangiaceae bacterium]|jgi:NAD+ kinase|nr:NAD(+)/NADH kinase [Polyangiaceae bacterium]
MSRPRVVVVAKRTAFRRFIEEEGDPRARNLLKKRDPSVATWLASHREHSRTLEQVERVLDRAGATTLIVDRAHAAFDTSDATLVIAVGGDGTLLAASHNVGSVPILGVNSAPSHSVGFFCAATRETFQRHLSSALEGKLANVRLTRMTVSLNGRLRSKRVLNEVLYSHSSPAATSRYILHLGKRREEQRSSGFWIGPAAGSTAAQHSAGGRVLPLGSESLQLVVREPYSPYGKYKLLRVIVGKAQQIAVQSKMDNASLYLDGPHRTIGFRLGDSVTFAVSDEPLTVLGLRGRKR